MKKLKITNEIRLGMVLVGLMAVLSVISPRF